MKRILGSAPFSSIVAFCALGLLVLGGCETGRTNKAHARAEATSDLTTTGKPQPGPAAQATGQPLVPGSPTAAGPDGKQPLNDSEARKSPGAEDVMASAPRRQPKDRFQHQ